MAVIQHITYSEYLPTLLGQALPPYTNWDPSLNPQVSNFFMVASSRYRHSATNSVFMRYEVESGCFLQEGHLQLRDNYYNPAYLLDDGIGPILLGLLAQPEQDIDTTMVDDARNHMDGLQQDLAAMNIQRGRDHGLPSYNGARLALGLNAAVDFSHVTSNRLLLRALSNVYEGDINKLDPWVGGLAEDSGAFGLKTPLGELFHTSIKREVRSCVHVCCLCEGVSLMHSAVHPHQRRRPLFLPASLGGRHARGSAENDTAFSLGCQHPVVADCDWISILRTVSALCASAAG